MLLKFKENLNKYKELDSEIENPMPNMDTIESILFMTKPFRGCSFPIIIAKIIMKIKMSIIIVV